MTVQRSIFITGGGSGIGRATAQHFAARGWYVGVADINEAGMAETLAGIAGEAKWSGKLDVRDRKGWDEALSSFAAAAGGRDNRGMTPTGNRHPFDALTPDAVLDALSAIGQHGDGRLTALNSFENRVYQAHLEDGAVVVLKFYRPKRWSEAQILEEHGFAQELAAAEVPVVPPLWLPTTPLALWACRLCTAMSVASTLLSPQSRTRLGCWVPRTTSALRRPLPNTVKTRLKTLQALMCPRTSSSKSAPWCL